jgi:hypothetical protein
MFDKGTRYKKPPSSKTIDWFVKNKKIKREIDSIRREQIICKIIKTRNTWSAHIDSDIQKIISIDEICKSNLPELLNKLECLLTLYNQWFIINRGWQEN